MLVLISNLLHGCKREEVASTGREEVAHQGVEMRLTVGKPSFRLDEQIEVSAVLVNQGKNACRISAIPDVTVHILAISKNGVEITPLQSIRTFIDSFDQFIIKTLVTLEPNMPLTTRIVSYRTEQDRRSLILASAASVSNQNGVIHLWFLDGSGTYTITADYRLPATVSLPSDMCQIAQGSATTTFTMRSN